ncbi:D-alanyl-D-alanine carboxypeptidase family protein [Anoxybacillus ayderensis]|uniref:M15 family metallopeptidase n=1 Tax=Anoxybacillus ayderensis TaxID=265546 RepID=UPI0015EB603F|nr:M15 family metallopeptidase [Anoxybacillus ayderensis]MBA2878169.1 D-alanyl-D-alanine carboxypeptidase [Anoxybacillus ayderensis]MED0657971.1 M15 family metallopeptidase [Anoxybacillus ayderensis]MED0685501.1 M15 family metallopeptidase [Anoxybacillus ayderensis]
MKKWLCCFVIIISGCQSFGSLEQEQKPSKPPVQVEEPARSPQTPTPPSEQQEQEELVLEEQFWNQVEVQNGLKVIVNPDNVLALVNKEQQLPADYKPADLVIPNVPFTFKETDVEKRHMRAEAAKALEEMFTAAKKQQMILYAVSGYRSYERQQQLFVSEVQRLGKEKAVVAVAMPGKSEHQTGLAIDITSPSVQYAITPAFGDTPEGKWVAQHAHEFGFIIRYPKGKEHITKYQYEPWHLRYVGKKAAKVIYEKQITLEEYFQIVKKI